MDNRSNNWLKIGLIITNILFLLGFVFNDKAVYFKNEKARHIWKGIVQLSFFALLGLFTSVWWAFVGAISYWILFDMIYNVVTLKKPLWYVGATAQIDLLFWKLFGKIAPVMMIIVKLSFLAFFIYILLTESHN